MLSITDYDPKFDNAIEAFDRDIFLELKYHRDVLRKDILIVVDQDGSFIGTGYLLASASYRLIERPLPEYFIHAIFKAGGTKEAEASVMLLDALIERFHSHVDEHPDKKMLLRLWCKETDTAYAALLQEMGFAAKDTMYVMRRDLSSIEDLTVSKIFGKASRNHLELMVKKTEPTDLILKEYIGVNEQAFQLPDSLDDLLFKLKFYDGSLYCAFLEDMLTASVTTWRIGEQLYATENIFCLPAAQNKGVTKALLGFVLLALKKAGNNYAALTVYKKDTHAIKLYSSFGYRLTHTLLEMHYSKDQST